MDRKPKQHRTSKQAGSAIPPHARPTYEELLARVAHLEEQIRERGSVETALQQSREKYHNLIETSVDFIWEVDPQGRYTFCSPQMERLWGLKPAEMIGTTPFDLIPEPYRARAARDFAEVAKSPRPFAGVETVSRDGHGHLVHVEISGVPFLDERGELLGFRGITRDISERKQAEEVLRRSQAEAQALLENTPAGLVLFEAKRPYRVLAHNRYYQELFEEPFRSQGMVGRNIFEYAPAVEAQGVVDVLEEVVRSQAPKSLLDFPYQNTPPKQSWFNWQISPLILDGEVVALASMSLDVTERHLAETARRESEEKYRNLFLNMTEEVHFWRVVRDENGQIATWRLVDANPPALKTWGRTSIEEIKGKTTDEIFGPGATEHFMPVVQKIMTEHAPHAYEDYFPNLDRYFRFTSIPLGSDYFITTGADISGLQRAMRLYEVLSRVNESIVRTRDEQSLFDQVCRIITEVGGFPLAWIGILRGREIVPVARCGPASEYLDAIRVEVDGELGQGPSGTAVREGRAVINDDFAENARTAPWREQALKYGFRASASFPLRSPDKVIGSLTLYSTRPGAFDQAQIKLLDSLCADLCYALDALAHERRRKEAEEELREANLRLAEADRRKTDFLAVLSHELRNPLAPITNSLYILDHAPPGGEQTDRAKQVIQRQVTQLTNLVNDLLDVTRITRNKIQLNKERLDLCEIVRRSVEDNRSFFEQAGIKLELVLAPRPAPVIADRTRIAQVLGNLLQNSAKFTGQGGCTRVSVATEGRQAVVRVADNGVGIASETLHRLFQPFMQAEQTLDRSKGGLGLGLALVKGLVELHGGSVSAHSDGLGRGAEVVVRLPLHTGDTLETPTAESSPARARRRVLIIEDNTDAADSLSEVLALGQHTVEIANNGPDGIAKARTFQPDVVLCDIGLPGMDGYEVARALRSDEQLKRTFLVALSGYALPEDLQHAAEAGFDRHLPKPPALEKLEELLAEAVTPV